jgi:hypothetical protein
MPRSVIVAITAVALITGLNLVQDSVVLMYGHEPIEPIVGMAISLGLGLLIIWGLAAGHRLAWQWGRILSGFMVVLLPIIVVMTMILLVIAPSRMNYFLLFQMVCVYMALFALGKPSARDHFHLRCPSCGLFTSSAADFFFNRAKCEACKMVR